MEDKPHSLSTNKKTDVAALFHLFSPYGWESRIGVPNVLRCIFFSKNNTVQTKSKIIVKESAKHVNSFQKIFSVNGVGRNVYQ